MSNVGKVDINALKKKSKEFKNNVEERKSKRGFRMDYIEDEDDLILRFGQWNTWSARKMALDYEGRRYLGWLFNHDDLDEDKKEILQRIFEETE